MMIFIILAMAVALIIGILMVPLGIYVLAKYDALPKALQKELKEFR